MAGNRGSSQARRARREALPTRSQTINRSLSRYGAGKNDVIALGGGVLQTSVNVLGFQVREVLQNLCLRHPGGQHFKHILHANAHPANARSSAALIGVNRDALKVVHAFILAEAQAGEKVV